MDGNVSFQRRHQAHSDQKRKLAGLKSRRSTLGLGIGGRHEESISYQSISAALLRDQIHP
jgi:hypothetical protein